MATTKLIATLFVLALVTLSPVCDACCGCKPPTPVTPTPTPSGKCPIDVLKLAACADVLGLVHAVLGTPPSGTKCCALLKGIADVEAALCLCTAIKANILGINLNVPVSLSVLLSACQKDVPKDFQCQ